MQVTSFSNPRIKEIRRLTMRREREKTRSYFIGGAHLVFEALAMEVPMQTLIVAPEILKERPRSVHQQILERCAAPRLEVSAEVFMSLAPLHIHHGVAAVLRQKWLRLEEIDPYTAAAWIVLDNVGYPANLGTMMRISDAVGAGGIILVGNTADPYDPAAVSASLGAVLSQRLVRTSVQDLRAWKEQHQLVFIGTSPTGSSDYRLADYRLPVILCMGSEHAGMGVECRNLCDATVNIPMLGRCESHNVAVATAIVMYEALGKSCTLGVTSTSAGGHKPIGGRAPPASAPEPFSIST